MLILHAICVEEYEPKSISQFRFHFQCQETPVSFVPVDMMHEIMQTLATNDTVSVADKLYALVKTKTIAIIQIHCKAR